MSKTIIIDAGSKRVRAGFGDEDGPRVIVSSSVLGASPMSLGKVTDVAGWTSLMQHIFANALNVDPTGCSIFLTMPTEVSKSTCEQLVKVLFDTFGAARAYAMNGAVCALTSQGINIGVVVEIGHDTMSVVPAYNTNVLAGAVRIIALGSRGIDEYLQTLLAQRGVSVDLQTAGMLKEGLGYIVPDEYEDESNDYQGDGSTSVNGTDYTLGRERFRSAECLLVPTLVGIQAEGIADMTVVGVQASDLDLRKKLYGNIVLAGGGSLLPGLPERLLADVGRRAPLQTPPRVIATADRDVIAWKGARSAAAQLTDELWISRAEYLANGPSIVLLRCASL